MSKAQKQKKPAVIKKPNQQDLGANSRDANADLAAASKLLQQVNKENLTKASERDKYENLLEEAFVKLSAACNKDATMHKAFFLRGKCYYHMGDFQRALFDFSVAIRIEEDNKKKDQGSKRELAEYYNFAGVQHYELGQLDEALQHYELAVKYDQKNGMYHYNKGLVKSRLDDVDAAIKSYKDALEHLEPQSQQDYVYQAKFNRGICYRRKGMLNESIEDLKQATVMKPEKASAHNNLALSYFESEYFDEALTHYTKAIQIEPSSVHYNNRGLANYHFDMFEEAKQDFDEALKKDPNDATIYFNRGNVYLNWKPIQMYDKAHEDYDMALEIAKANPKLWHSKGLAFQGQSEFIFQQTNEYDQELNERAIEMYDQALKLQENFVSSRFHLGLMLHRTNQFQEALKCFTKVIEKISDDKTVYVARGTVYQDMGNHLLAIKDFDTAIKLDVNLSEAYFRQGFSKYFIKRYHEAIEDFKISKDKEEFLMEEDSNYEPNPGIYDGLGCCYHALRQWDQAHENYDQAIKAAPENTDFLLHRANCFYDEQKLKSGTNFEASINDLQTALQFQSKNPQLLYKLGLSFYAHKEWKHCVNTLKLALKNKPFPSYEPDIYYHIGLAYCIQEKFEKAIYPFTQAINMIPSEIKYIHERAKTYQMIDDHENAVVDFSTVIQKNPKNAHAHFRRAFSFKALGKYSEGVEDFEQAKRLDPTNPMMVVNYKQLKGVTCIVLCKPGEEKEY